LERFKDPTYYYLFRKRFAQHLAVVSTLEMLVNLSPLFLDDVYIRTATGQLAVPKTRFSFDLAVNRVVPFRLTPNLEWFLGMTLEGDYLWSVAAVVRCLFSRDQHLLLRPLILDEIVINGNHDQVSACNEANKFISNVVAKTTRMATQDAAALQEEVHCAIEKARNHENLSQMDPRVNQMSFNCYLFLEGAEIYEDVARVSSRMIDSCEKDEIIFVNGQVSLLR
uniref:PI3K/PI4K catalytic domain-containing protein n=1 Tax=Angiostrongylus cantonensis TaxID=6313 RepID=A0A0K0DRH8_ANGCA